MELDYITVLLGSTNSYLHIQGPYEILSRVDCFKQIPYSKIQLLHLEYPIFYNRFVRSTYILDANVHEIETDECLALTADSLGRLLSWPVQRNQTECPIGYRCYEVVDDVLCHLTGKLNFLNKKKNYTASYSHHFCENSLTSKHFFLYRKIILM